MKLLTILSILILSGCSIVTPEFSAESKPHIKIIKTEQKITAIIVVDENQGGMDKIVKEFMKGINGIVWGEDEY